VSGTIDLIGPSTTPGAPQITRADQLNTAINAVLVTKTDATNGFLTNPTITGGTIVGAPVSGSTGAFSTLSSLGNATVGGTLGVTGATTLGGPASLTAAGTGLAVTNNATVGGTLAVTGATTLTGNVNTGAGMTLGISGTNVNRLVFTPTAAGSSPSMQVGGPSSDTNVGLTLRIKGTGVFSFQNATGGVTNVETGVLSVGKGQTRTYAGAASVAQADLKFQVGLAGTITSGQQSAANFFLPADVATMPSGGSIAAIQVIHTTAAGATGNRWMYDASTVAGAASTNLQLGGIRTTASSAFNMGGTGLDQAATLSLGNLWGGNDVVQAGAGATFLNGVVGREIDVSMAAGSSANTKFGLAITQLSTDVVQGTWDDAALSINNQAGTSPGWKTLIGVGRNNGIPPMDPVNGWVLKFIQTLGVGTLPGAGGLDFTNFVPTTAFMRGANFLLDPSGNFTANTLNVGANKVVGARDTGWTAMTGSPDKATAYATGSMTLAQLAGRVAQLQASLTTHGLVGP
jgi:fibronectin-binding autotransporter adhesin